MKAFAMLLILGAAAAVVVSSGGPGGSVSGDMVQTISEGERVELEEHLEDGTWTLIEFTADW